jgi:hypothetical protein
MGEQFKQAVLNDDWAAIAMLVAQLGEKMNHVEVPVRHRLGTPWVGAWEQLNK